MIKISKYKNIIIGLVILISLVGLFAWSTGELLSAKYSELYIPIAPLTALSFIVISLVMLVFSIKKLNKKVVVICYFFLAMVLLISVRIIYEWVFNTNWKIERFLVTNPESFGDVLTGRMSPFTAYLFVLESLAIMFYNSYTRKLNKYIYGLIVFVSFFISSVFLIGYLYKAPLLYGSGIIPVALPTAVNFWLLSIALIVTADFGFWPFSLLKGNSIESKLTKAFLPITLLLVILNGYLNADIFVNFHNHTLFSAIFMILTIPIFGFIIVSISKNIGKSLKKANQTIIETEHRFSNAIVNAPFPIMIHSEGEVIQLSAAWTKITGYTIKDIPTIVEWSKKAYGNNAVPSQEFIHKLYELETVKQDGEWKVTTSDGSIRVWEFMTSPLGKLPDGRRVVSSMAVDVTIRKQLEKQVKEKNKALKKALIKSEESDLLKSEFINNMSHEIRTPMNGILGFSGLLNNPDLSVEKRQNFINIIQSSGNQLLHVIDDLIAISSLGTKQVKVLKSEVCLNNVLLELFSIFDIKAKENKTPLYLKNELSDKQSTIITDKSKVNKVVSNLLENALKFTKDGSIEFGYQLKNKKIKIYIKDTGIGIDAAKHKLIFKRFSQAEKDLSNNVGGLGLGLSIVKENVSLLGGKVSVESEKGAGATFFVTIPYEPVYSEAEVVTAQKEKTVLIAEDEEVNYLYLETLFKSILKFEGTILHAKNGEEAIELIKNNPVIDLVLMDLKMPIINGYDATKKIKQLYPNIAIVAQTAYSTPDEQKKAIAAGCDDFISKPIGLEAFKSVVKKYL